MIFSQSFVLLLKQCKVEKEDDQLILAIFSKLGADYLIYVSTFHAGNLTTPRWNIPSLNSFIESLTSEHDNLVQMGIIRSSHDQALHVSRPKDLKGKESSRRNQNPNSKLLSLKLKTSSMKTLLAQRRTKEKGIMERKKSSVHTTRRASTMNILA